jgi:hypothetical protein
VSFVHLTETVDLAQVLPLAFVDLAVAAVFGWAYARTRRHVFLLLVASMLGFVYSNLFAASASLFGATHIRLFSGATMRAIKVNKIRKVAEVARFEPTFFVGSGAA